MKKFRKLLAILCATAVCTAAFVGCSEDSGNNGSNEGNDNSSSSANSASSETGGSSEDEVTTIRVHSGLWSRVEESQYIRDVIIPQFEEEHPNIKLEFEFATSTTDMLASLEVQSETEWSDDIIINHDGDMSYIIDNGWVTDMTEFKNSLGLTFMEVFDKATVSDGKAYFLPISADVYLTLVNNEALDYLPEGVDPNALTWEGYVEWSKALLEGTGSPKTALGYMPLKSVPYQVGAIALSYGGLFPQVDSDGFKKAMGFVGEMAPTYVADGATADNPAALLNSDQAWLTFYHMGPVSEVYSAAPSKYTVYPAPSGDNGTGSIAGAFGIGITPGGAEKQEAVETFLKWFTEPETLLSIVKNTGGTIPPIQEVMDIIDDENATENVIKMGISTLQNGIVSGTNAALYQDFNAVKNVYDQIIAKVLADGSVDDAYLTEMQAELDALLK